MKEVNGFTYSKKPFEGYKFRGKFKVSRFGIRGYELIEFYTDNPHRNEVEKLLQIAADKKYNDSDVSHCKITSWFTLEDDKTMREIVDMICD